MKRRTRLNGLPAPIWFLAIALLVAGPAWSAGPLTIDADDQFAYARSRFAAGAFDEAIIEFNRFIHFFPDDARVERARFAIARALLQADRFDKAAPLLDALTRNWADRPVQRQAFILLSRCHAALGMHEQAMVDLHNLLALTDDAETIDRAWYEMGWRYVELSRWEAAGQTFGRITPANQDRFRVDRLTAALALGDQIPTKSPALAGTLSVIPGGGQFYCGRYQDGLTALLINAALIGAAWEAFDEDMVFLGGAISIVEFGFYAGNIYGAISGAHKINRDRKAQFRQRLEEHLRVPLAVVPTPKGAALCLRVDF